MPWVSGAAEFAARDFSGFDLARLVRNFEVVAASSREAGQLRATAVVLYLVPALAINGAIFAWLPFGRPVRLAALAAAAAYPAVILCATFWLSVAGWTELQRVLAEPLLGFWLVAAGCADFGVATGFAVAAGRSSAPGPVTAR